MGMTRPLAADSYAAMLWQNLKNNFNGNLKMKLLGFIHEATRKNAHFMGCFPRTRRLR
jgi:hypothetical protein